MLSWIIQFAIAFVLWHLYVGKIDAAEALFGAGAAAVAALASKVVFEEQIAPLRAEWRSAVQIWRIPKYLVVDTWQILGALFQQVFRRTPAQSLFFSVPFDAGGDDGKSAFRRALAIAYSTATPNFVVIGIDRAHGRLVYHQLQQAPVTEMTKRLGARP